MKPMKRVSKFFRQYLPFSSAGIKGVLAYKAQTFMWLFIAFVDVFFIVFLYQAIYRNSPDGMNSVINGFTFYEMVLYMITSFVFSFVLLTVSTLDVAMLFIIDCTLIRIPPWIVCAM